MIKCLLVVLFMVSCTSTYETIDTTCENITLDIRHGNNVQYDAYNYNGKCIIDVYVNDTEQPESVIKVKCNKGRGHE